MMGCLKCGRDLEDGQVFCDRCLGVMERYPVKPGTPVFLPKHRVDSPPRKSSRLRLPLTPEAQVKRLRNQLRWAWGLAAVFLTVCLVLGIVFLRHQQSHQKLQPGQNYSAIETTPETTAE